MAKVKYRKTKGITAWLVTWEHDGDHTVPPCRIAAIINYRWSAERVREFVELLYVNEYYSPEERIAYAKNKSFNPYPAEFNRINGVQCQDQITCGHNPYLYARLVDNLVAGGNDFDKNQVTWNERSLPDYERIIKFLGKKPEV